MSKGKLFITGGILALALAACSPATGGAQIDQVATQVAVARAVAATLTADAPSSTTVTPPTAAATIEATAVPATAAATTEATVVPPTATSTSEPAATATSAPRPTLTAPRPPTPTNTPVAEVADPFVPGVGTPKGLVGKIALPGYSGPLDSPVFRDRIVFKLVVFDPAFGTVDGAGIKGVNITAVDPLGRTVIEQREGSWAYCAFGNPQNGPACDAWRFSEHGFTWPNGTPVCAGSGYSADMVVETENPANDGANWRFEFAIESPDGSLPSCF